MLTQCPSCQTTFRVTSEILRVAHGQVRCGRCQTQFNALKRLIEEDDEGGGGNVETGRYMRPPRAIPPPPPQRGQIEVEEPVEHEDITLEGRHIEISGVYEAIDESGQGQPQIHEEVVEEWVEMEEDDATVDAEPDVIDVQEQYSDAPDDVGELSREEDIRAAVAKMAAAEEQRARTSQTGQWATAVPVPATNFTNGAPRQREFASTRARRLKAEAEAAAIEETEEASELDFATPRTRQRKDSVIWSVLAVPFALLLIVQVVHNYRATLARHPQLGMPLQTIYSALGLTLRPDWNLHAYEVQQWGIVSDPASPGTLKVRASVKNLAEFAQPYPLVKLILEDRWGEQVRAREFEPSEYLDPTLAANRLLAPAQQANATIVIVDPGPDAEGFRFDVCLRGARGPICAADLPGTK